jgi:hypothetical protein
MPLPQQLPRSLTAVILVASLVYCFSPSVEAKSKKGRRASAQTRSKSRGYARRSVARRGKRYRNRPVANDQTFASYPASFTVPDKIEVIEAGSSDEPALAPWFNLPKPGNVMTNSFMPIGPSISVRRINVRIEQSRVLEIQQSLAGRGFYQGEMTGVYDDATADAMRRFQINEKISATGYPTAHALKRLGLASW